ncbi:MAG: transposase [Syntrophaceticus sp.]
MAYIKGENVDQITLFPEKVDDYISSDNPVRVIKAFVDSLDMKELGFKRYVSNCYGRPSYDPRDLLKLYIYGYLNRIRSSRKLETEAGRNLELMWLLRKLKPDFKTIADFRKDNKKAIKNVFKQFNLLCKKWDLFACPAGRTLYPSRIRKVNNVEYQEYKNFCVCKTCEFKERCTSSEKGRTILRNLDQALLNEVDKRTRENKELYAQRQMIVEHPYGTIKGIWGYSYFLTRGLLSVNIESALSFLAYNLRRAINILGVEKMVKRLAPA